MFVQTPPTLNFRVMIKVRFKIRVRFWIRDSFRVKVRDRVRDGLYVVPSSQFIGRGTGRYLSQFFIKLSLVM